MDLFDKLSAVRERALTGGLPVRRKDRQLYGVLAECLAVCEEAIRDNQFAELKENITKETGAKHGTGSTRVKPTSDIYNLVCRYVFGGRQDYSSLGKYAQTIREAANRQISSSKLEQWLCDNGGARALYLTIKTPNPGMTRVTLNLNEPITFPKDANFSIVLKYDGKGFFDVVQKPLRCE